MSGMTTRADRYAERGASSADVNGPLADWIRLPKPKERLGGLSRSTWRELLDSGKVRGLTLRKSNARRGIRLIHKPSAEQYLTTLMDGCTCGRRTFVSSRDRRPPRRLREHEGESKPAPTTLGPTPNRGKPFDVLERKLSLALDALLDAIDAYRESRR